MLKQVYFDCNATTPTLAPAAQAAVRAMEDQFGNPSSPHLAGIRAKSWLESTRNQIAGILNVRPLEITFTSGATEAIQMAVFSALDYLRSNPDRPRLILYGATEHKAVPEAIYHWNSVLGTNFKIEPIPVLKNGLVDLDALKTKLPECSLICTMAVNNETGVIQDLNSISKLLDTQRPLRPFWLVDCVQGLGKVPLDLNALGVDYACFSGHKLYAPKGIGFLYAKDVAPLKAMIVGGGQEKGIRSGTENLPGVAALGEALKCIFSETSIYKRSESELVSFRKQITDTLTSAFPKIVFNTPFECSVPTTINFAIPGFSSRELLDLFDAAGIRLSSGSACNSQKLEPSHVLAAMHLPEWQTTNAVRLSFGPATTADEIKLGCERIRQVALALEGSCLLQGSHDFEAPETLRDGLIQLRVGPTNCWILADKDEKTCVIIDPFEPIVERLENFVRCQKLKVVGIFDTHHNPHQESIRPYLKKILCPELDAATESTLGWPQSQKQVTLADGQTYSALPLGKGQLIQVPCKSHPEASQLLLYTDKSNTKLNPSDIAFAFCGDMLSSGSLPESALACDSHALFESLRNLAKLIDDKTFLCSARHYTNHFANHFAQEKEKNALLKLSLQEPKEKALEAFSKEKQKIEERFKNSERSFKGIVCSINIGGSKKSEASLNWAEAKTKIQNPNTILVDVREPQEFGFKAPWSELGVKSTPKNVPLSRLVQFLSDTLRQETASSDIIFICRTGSRSQQAAMLARSLGVTQAWNLEGGLALIQS